LKCPDLKVRPSRRLLKRAYSNAFAVTSAVYSVFRLPRKLTRVTPNSQIRFILDLRGSAKTWQKLAKVGRTGDHSIPGPRAILAEKQTHYSAEPRRWARLPQPPKYTQTPSLRCPSFTACPYGTSRGSKSNLRKKCRSGLFSGHFRGILPSN
jgi:hypothetical protein